MLAMTSGGACWRAAFTGRAAARPTRGSFRDGWDFARAHRRDLGPDAARELALAEVRWSYDGESPPRPRRLAARRTPGGVAVLVRGYVRVFGRGPDR